VIGALYFAEACLRLVVGLFRKAPEPEDPSQQGPGHRAVVPMPPGRQPAPALVKKRRLDDALKVALRFRQPANPEQYHTHTPIGEHDACRVADLLGYRPGTLGRCRRFRVFATKANHAREIQQNTQLGAQITQSFGGLKRLGEHDFRLLGRAPRVKQTVPEADLQPHP
jgi:hypothetical protein